MSRRDDISTTIDDLQLQIDDLQRELDEIEDAEINEIEDDDNRSRAADMNATLRDIGGGL